MTIGERIKKIRDTLNMNQVDFASLIDVSKQTLYKYENDIITNIPSDKIERIAEVSKTSPAYVMGWEHVVHCPICYQTYDPLNKYDSEEHNEFHKKFLAAENKYGKILLYGEVDKKRSECIFRLNNRTLPVDERITAFEDYLKYNFMLSIWNSHFDLSHEDFETFCKKEMGLSTTREVLDNIGDDVYQKMVDKYGIADDSDYHKIAILTKKDNRDIKKDLDSIMEKLSNQEYGPAAYDGEYLSVESVELFRDELEIALKRLKLINKEKYNPNKNKK